MPATDTYALPYPALTDAPNVPLYIQQLADRVEALLAQASGVHGVGTGDVVGTTKAQPLAGKRIETYSEKVDTGAGTAYGASNIHQPPSLTGNIVATLTCPKPAGEAWTVTVIHKQDATGGRNVTWPAGVKWVDGARPAEDTRANRINVWTFMTTDGGATWLGWLSGPGMA